MLAVETSRQTVPTSRQTVSTSRQTVVKSLQTVVTSRQTVAQRLVPAMTTVIHQNKVNTVQAATISTSQ